MILNKGNSNKKLVCLSRFFYSYKTQIFLKDFIYVKLLFFQFFKIKNIKNLNAELNINTELIF